MSSRPELKLDWCSYEAAKYAIEHWHYSRKMPIGKLVKVGAWEGGLFVGVVLYSTGASPQLHKAFGVGRMEVCELVRVALREHASQTTRIMAISLRLLRRLCPRLRVIVSFADPAQGHYGGIYQGGNWIYIGRTGSGIYYQLPNGAITHNRNLQGPKGFGSSPTEAAQTLWSQRLAQGLKCGSVVKLTTEPKHKYIMPLDDAMRQQIEPLRKPYPKRAGSADSGTADDQSAGGGASPTSALCDATPVKADA